MSNRTVKVDLVAGTTSYDGPVKESTKTTAALTLAQKEAALAAKKMAADEVSAAQAIAIAEKQAAAAAKAAALEEVTDADAVKVAKAEATAAAKESAAQERASAKAITAAQKDVKTAASEVTKAQRELAQESKATAKAEVDAAKAAQDAAKKRSEAYTDTGKKMMVAGAVLVGAFLEVEKATTSFDKALSGVQAVSGASAGDMDKLSAAALKAGKDTVFTATEAAAAEGELVKAGVSVQDVLGGALTGTLALAAAGQLGLADAATISANAMNTFALKGSDVGHIADVLASGANKSAADVKELAYGLQQGGLVAAQTGLTFEDTTAVLAAFADRGLKGADAGTSLKTMLEKLNAPSTQAAALMDHLGITAYDASGKFVGVKDVAGQLHDKLGGLTDQQRNSALATIFGSDAIRAATVLYSLGADGVKGYTDKMNDTGAASRMAAEQLNNLSGDLEQLKGSLETAMIGSGQGANNILRTMTQEATGAVNAFMSFPKPVQEAAVGFAGIAGSGLLVVGGLTTAAGKVGEMRKTLQGLATTAEGVKGVLGSVGTFMTGPWGLAIAGAATVVMLLKGHLNEMKVEVADFTATIKEDGNALGDATVAAVAADLAHKGLYDTYGKLGVSQDTVTKAAMGNADAMNEVAAATARALKAGGSVDDLAAAANNLGQIHATADGLHKQLAAQQQATAATTEATAATKAQADSQAFLVQSAKNLAGEEAQRTAGLRAQFDATNAAKDAAKANVEVTKSSTGATKDNASVTGAATSAKHSMASADKSATLAGRDATKAAADHTKANDAAAKAATAAADASRINASSASTEAEKKKATAAATKDATAATKAATTAQNADTRASDASATAADKASRASDAVTKAASAKAKAADAAGKASSDEAAAQQAAANAAADAAFEHQIGVTALQGWAAAAKDTKHSSDVLADSVTAEVGAMKDAKTKADGLKEALDALNGVHIQAGKAALDVQGKIADLTKSLRDNGTTLDITSDKGRANMGVIYDLASAINSHAQAVVDETGSVSAGNDALKSSRDEFDKVLTHAGLSKDAIQHFNDTLLATPTLVPVVVSVDTYGALQKMREFHDKATGLVTISVGSISTGTRSTFATGGRIYGPGSDTSDSVPIMASRNEFVLNAGAARAIGYTNLERWNTSYGGGGSAVRPQLAAQSGGAAAHAGGATAGGVAAVEMRFSGGTDSALATVIMNLARTGKLQLVTTS